jgi:hypothetical protein
MTMRILNMEQFGLGKNQEEDATLEVYWALKDCRDVAAAPKATFLLFPKGRYHFWPEKAVEKQYFITNHDQGGTRKTAFPIFEINDLVLDGQSSEFVFHGPMIPFIIENCRNVILKNFSIDWERPMFEQGTVIQAADEFFDFQLPKDTFYECVGNRLFFEYGGQMVPVWGLHNIDPLTKAHVYQSGDRLSWNAFKQLDLEEAGAAGSGCIRVKGKLQHIPLPGSIVVMRIGRRENPGIFLKNNVDTRVEKVEVYHAPGMGLVAQRCTNIHLHAFNVII